MITGGFENREFAGALTYLTNRYTVKREVSPAVTDNLNAGGVSDVDRPGLQVQNVSCPLLVGEEIYFCSDNGIASCIDAHTGESNWYRRIGKRYWASPLYADGHIYFFERDGATTVIAPGKTYELLAENQLDGEIQATAAAVDGALIIRTDKALYCIR